MKLNVRQTGAYIGQDFMQVSGFAKNFFLQKSEFTMEVGGWVGPDLTRNFFLKSSQNCSKPVLIFWSTWYVVYNVYAVCMYIPKSCRLL